MSPEGVPLRLELASIGARIGAQILDLTVTTLAALALLLLIDAAELVAPDAQIAIASMLFLFIRIPYYVLSELAWNGQTLGKRLMQIKVVASDGGSLTTNALVMRNIIKEGEIFFPASLLIILGAAAAPVETIIASLWIIGTLLVPLLNKRRRRLGDLLAGTYVVTLPTPILLADLAHPEAAPAESSAAFAFMTHHLDHYGVYELQTLEGVIRAHGGRGPLQKTAEQRAAEAQIVQAIRRKISYADPVPADDHHRFLHDFYRAQRQHLEQRQLFGDQRADKFHRQGQDGAKP
ncbi:MAG: RDD family protein [Pseudomonadota bacterium]